MALPKPPLSLGGSQTINASYVSAGVFGSNSTKGNYEFQHSNTTANVMYIDATNDRVGIGTTGPAYQLDVGGFNSSLLRAPSDLGSARIIGVAAGGAGLGNGAALNLGIYGDRGGVYLRSYQNAAGSETADFYISQNNSTANAVNRFTILGASGNVGIGTVSPGGKLQVGTAGTQSAYTYGTGNGDGLLFNFYNDGSPYTRHADIVSSAADASAADIKFFTKAASANPLERVRIDSQGNVGIATTTPGYPLTVAGTIYSTTGGFRFPDATTQTTAYLGSSQTVTAGNVSSGAFGFPSASNAYAFPAALAIGTSTTTGLPTNGLL